MKHTWLADAIAALTDERRQVATRLDAIDLAIDNLRRLTSTDKPTSKTARTIKERRVVERRHGHRRQGKRAPLTADQSLSHADERANSAARMDAVLAFLRRNSGIGTVKQLRGAMPSEHELTDQQRTRALSNTLSRLKAKGVLGRTGDTWSLVGQGSQS